MTKIEVDREVRTHLYYCDFCLKNRYIDASRAEVITLLVCPMYKNNKFWGIYYFCNESCLNLYLLQTNAY